MKSKGSASLYEVLKSASRPGNDPAAAPPSGAETPQAANEEQKTLQERLAEYKARKLAAAQSPAPSLASTSVAVADPTPIPVAVADPTPLPAPAETVPTRSATQILTPISTYASTPSPSSGPGERVFKLTYNTAAFAALVVVGLAFVSYAVGVKVGRARTAETMTEPAAAREAVKPAAPPAPPKVFSIHLVEWPSRTSQEHVNSVIAADNCKKALEKAGFKNVETVKIMRGGEERLALYVDRFKDTASEPARSRLASIQKVKVQNQSPFAQAFFEEVPRDPSK